MKRKLLEEIPPLKAEKSKDEKWFVAAVEIVNLKEEKYLILDIYRNLKKRLKEPLVRVCLTKKEYANYYFEKGIWTQQNIDNINTEEKVFIRYATVAMTSENEKKILNFVPGYSYENWMDRIRTIQRNCIHEKQRRKDEIRYEKLDQRIQSMPVVPEGFYKWCEEKLLRNSKYIFYKRKGRYAEFSCGCCGNEYRYAIKQGESYESQFEKIVGVPRENHWGRCEVCDEQAVYKCAGRQLRISDKKSCYLLQRYGERGVVIRYFDIYKTSQPGAIPVYEDVEINRSFFEPGMNKVQKDYQVNSGFTGELLWIPNNIPGLATITVKAAELYPDFREEIKGTMLEYSGIEYWMKEYDTFKVESYMETYWKLPALEMLVKMGCRRLADGLINGDYGTWNEINRSGKTPEEVLMIDRKKMKKLVKEEGDKYCHELLKLEKKMGIDLKEEQEDALMHLTINTEDLKNMLHCMSAQQIINRVKKYAGVSETSGELCQCAETHLRAVGQMYGDYISMRMRLDYDMTNQIYVYPRNLKEEHDKLVLESSSKEMETRIKEVNTKYPVIKERYQELCEIYQYEDNRFCIRPAKSAGEIVEEGRILHHCVGGDGYLSGYNRGSSIILMLRPVLNKKMPFITIEIKGFAINQWYGANNKKPMEKEIDDWLKEYLKKAATGTLNLTSIV